MAVKKKKVFLFYFHSLSSCRELCASVGFARYWEMDHWTVVVRPQSHFLQWPKPGLGISGLCMALLSLLIMGGSYLENITKKDLSVGKKSKFWFLTLVVLCC